MIIFFFNIKIRLYSTEQIIVVLTNVEEPVINHYFLDIKLPKE
jgi:hypothetical protein